MKKLHQDTMRYEHRTNETMVKDVELVDVIPIFSILASGILLAICVFFLERVLVRRHQNNCCNYGIN
jgi:hypothetical protein